MTLSRCLGSAVSIQPTINNINSLIENMTDQKVAIVTGGNSGIGRATAIALAKEGVKIVVAARRSKEGQETVHLINEAESDGIFVKTDVANEASVRSLVEKTIDSYHRLDYAFNNAGIEQTMASIAEQTVEEFDQIMNVNVRGVWLSMKYEIPEMIKNGVGGGAIVNNSSVAGIMGFPQMAIYIASKHAVLGLTKSAALEYAKSGIRINAIAPGGVKTEMANRVNEDNPQFLETLTSMHPIGRISKSRRDRKCSSLVISEKASFVLGHTLLVDGGVVSR